MIKEIKENELSLKDKIQKMNLVFEDMINSSNFKKLKDYVLNLPELPEFIFAGVGKNWYICEKIVKTYISMGLMANALDCTHALHGDIGMLQNNNNKIIFFLSKSGTTEEMIKLVNIINVLKEKNILKNVFIVAVSLNKEIDNSLYDLILTPTSFLNNDCNYEFDKRNLVPSLSINTMQSVLDLLGVEIYEANPELVNNYIYNHLAGHNGQVLGGPEFLKKSLKK